MFSGLSFVAAFGLMALLIWRVSAAKGRSVSALSVGVGAAIPVALICLCLLDAGRASRMGELRLTLAGLDARLAPGQALSIGGDRDRDDLVVAGLGPSMLELRSIASGDPSRHDLLATPRLSIPSETPVLVGRGRDRHLSFYGQVPFADGDALCLSDCDVPGARWFVLRGRTLQTAHIEQGRIVADDQGKVGLKMPTRLVLDLVPGIVFWTPRQAIHPLRDHLPPTLGGKGGQGCGTRYFCVPGPDHQPTPAASFLFREGGRFQGGWRLMLLDPGARYAPKGQVSAATAPKLDLAPLAAGERVAFSVWEIRYSTAAPGEKQAALSRLVERRSFTITNDPNKVSMTLDTPERRVAGGCEGEMLDSANLSGAVENGAEGSSMFAALGGRSAQAANGPLPLSERRCDSFHTADLTFGDLALDQRAVHARLDRMSFPAPMVAIALFWAVIAALAQRELWRENRLAWTLVNVLQLLLALRWLIALAGVAADPTLDWRPIVRADGVAYVVCPALFMLATAPSPKRLTAWIMVTIFEIGAVASLIAWTGPPGRLASLVLALFAMALAVMIALCLRPGLAKTVVDFFRDQAHAKGLALMARAPRLPRGEPWMWWLGGALAFRVILALFGFKERVGLAVSALYTPLLILGFSDLMARAQRADPPHRSRYWAVYCGAALILAFILPWLVHDIGYAMVLAPLALLPAARALTAPGDLYPARVRLAWSGPAILIIAGLLILAAAGGVLKLGVTDGQIRALARADDSTAIALLERQTRLDPNRLRLAAVAMPEQLASAGTTEAENLLAWSVHLANYTQPLLGRGYMAPSRLNAILRPVQMDDNVSAVHVMSPFGRLGAATLLVLLASLALTGARLTRSRNVASLRPAREIAGLLALWWLFGVAAYVILANLQLVPFTGRNVYLLAASSGSDLVEGVSLFALALWGLSSRREPG